MSPEHYKTTLRSIALAGVYRMPQGGLADLLAAAAKLSFFMRRINLASVRDKDAFFESIALAFEFPDWFGHNWDALADCLSDLSWLRQRGYVLLLEHCGGFRANHAEDFATALQIFAETSNIWREENVPFWILVDTPADAINSFPGIT